MVFEKMSKSKRNGVDPLDVLSKNGVDITRLQLIDSAAPRQEINWDESDDKGLKKWIDRVAWIVSAYVGERKRLADSLNNAGLNTEFEEKMREGYNFFVRNVSMCLEVLNLHNTALARLQGFTNSLRKLDPSLLGTSPETERSIYALVTMMQVFAPYTASELWAALQSVQPIRKSAKLSGFIDEMSWPQVDPDCTIDFMLIVDGIGCGRIPVPRQEVEHLPLEKLLERAKTHEHSRFFEKITERNFIFKSVTLSKRDGFHVTINITLAGNVDPREITQILNELEPQWRASTKRKRKAEAIREAA
ncbi:tRNA synthetases class I (I, L, M and V) [Parelaphostrongylus tenuis]|uniref:leucine--tRNA ligase n=1 Tax=Parelaphostrongylus tenuis TaxID=148309 RepID=A0AAD5R7Q0_PARTN|nr:tRNA synthetases class I (I, L, M and V) [Parelaphostrongylus tenuis]